MPKQIHAGWMPPLMDERDAAKPDRDPFGMFSFRLRGVWPLA